MLVIKRIHVTYSGVDFEDADQDKVQRVLDTHAGGCPVARSLRDAITITTSINKT